MAESADLGIGGGGGAAQGRQDLDLIAAGRADQQNADALDRGQSGVFRCRRHAEMGEQEIAAPPLDFHFGQTRERAGARLQLGVLHRQREHVIGAQREGVRRDCRRLLGGSDDDGQIAGGGAGLELGEQRQAVLDPGVDQHEVGAIRSQRRRGALVAVAQDELAAPLAQPSANGFQRLVGPLQHEETGGLSHARFAPGRQPLAASR